MALYSLSAVFLAKSTLRLEGLLVTIHGDWSTHPIRAVKPTSPPSRPRRACFSAIRTRPRRRLEAPSTCPRCVTSPRLHFCCLCPVLVLACPPPSRDPPRDGPSFVLSTRVSAWFCLCVCAMSLLQDFMKATAADRCDCWPCV